MRSVLAMMIGIILSLSARSQLCSGSLGDPVAHITFGSGSQQGPPLDAGKTNYRYIQGSCPEDGSYTITNLSSGCFGQTWHTIVSDHTPNDAGGYYMLVNASTAPGVFYVDTISSLCGNTSYEFSSYVLNAVKPTACANQPIAPDLTFTIETLNGDKLTTYNSGRIPATDVPTWKQFGTFITTPPGVSTVVIRITNNAPGGCGNDLAIDDIMFRPCGPLIVTEIQGTTSKTITYCEPDPRDVTLKTSVSGGFTNPRLQWQVSSDEGVSWSDIPGETSETLLRKHTPKGTYYYRAVVGDGNNINNTACRIASETMIVEVQPPASITVSNFVNGCLGSAVPLMASGAQNYTWTGPNGFSSNLQGPIIPAVQYRDSGIYTVVGTTPGGCSGSASTYLKVFENARITVTPSVSGCEGNPIQLNSSGGVRIKWDPSQGLDNDTSYTPVANIKESTRYKATIVNQFNCFDTATVQVSVLKLPKAEAGPDIKMLRDRPAVLKSSISGTNVTYSWTPTTYMINPTALAPSVNPPSDARYRLTVSSNAGCGTSTDEVEVKVYDRMKIPNTFTPNGDGYNDVWEIDPLSNFDQSVVEVYNTAGQLVHRNVGYSKPWDGTRNGAKLPAGTYYYVIDLKASKTDKFTGYITIIR
jgi:gliding motility-associated-like protein